MPKSSSKVLPRRGIQILIRHQDGSVERSIFMCRPNISFKDLFQEVRQKRLKKYVCCAVHVTGELNSYNAFKDVSMPLHRSRAMKCGGLRIHSK